MHKQIFQSISIIENICPPWLTRQHLRRISARTQCKYQHEPYVIAYGLRIGDSGGKLVQGRPFLSTWAICLLLKSIRNDKYLQYLVNKTKKYLQIAAVVVELSERTPLYIVYSMAKAWYNFMFPFWLVLIYSRFVILDSTCYWQSNPQPYFHRCLSETLKFYEPIKIF